MTLSRRQRQVLQFASEGLTSRETAIILKLAWQTVKNHRWRAIKALDADSMTHAVAIALREGLIK